MNTTFDLQVREVIDLSHEVSDKMEDIAGTGTSFITTYSLAKTRQLSGGKAGFAARMMLISEHAGTHLDVPCHFVEGGADVASIPISTFVLPGHLLDLTHRKAGEAITIADFERAETRSGREIGAGAAIICWTGVDKIWGEKDMNRRRPHVPADAAQWLVDKKITLFATDLIGIDNPDEWTSPTHYTWLSNGVCMVQQLCNLEQLVGKRFLFVALPLKTVGGTGCPVRAAAIVM